MPPRGVSTAGVGAVPAVPALRGEGLGAKSLLALLAQGMHGAWGCCGDGLGSVGGRIGWLHDTVVLLSVVVPTVVVPKPWWSWAMGSREPHAGRCCRVSPHPCHLSPAMLAAPTRVQAQLCSLLGLAAVALGNLCPPAKHPGDFGSLLGQLRPHCPHSWGRAGTGLGAADTAGSGAEPPPCVALRLHFPGPPPHFAP